MLQKRKDMPDEIIVTITVIENEIIIHIYYSYLSLFIEDYLFDFKPYEYSKHLFSRIGEKLGEDLFLELRRILLSLPSKVYFYNGYKVDEIGIGGDELESFCSAFWRGLKKGFQTLCIDSTGTLSKFAKEFSGR